MFRTRIALGLAAVALMGMSFTPIDPAFAAPVSPAIEHEYAGGGGQLPRPDLSVKITNVYHSPNGHSQIYFTVANIGTADSGSIAVKLQCADSNYNLVLASAAVGPGLKAGDSRWGSFYCDNDHGGAVTVGTQNDSNTSNNYVQA